MVDGSARRNSFSLTATPYLLIAPVTILVLIVLGYSVAYGIWMSVHDVSLTLQKSDFLGLKNYIVLFNDPNFINSLIRTIIFVLSSLVLGLVLSIAFALALNACRNFSTFFQIVTLVPYLISGIATAVMFRFIFSGSVGFINQILMALGRDPVRFLSDGNWAMFVVILANVWFLCPFAALIVLSGLRSIDGAILEAARVDGASRLRIFFSIVIPLISPMMAITLIWLTFGSFNMFDVVLPLTAGGPARATDFLAVYMYHAAFRRFQFSIGSAIMVIILFFNAATSAFYLKLFSKTGW